MGTETEGDAFGEFALHAFGEGSDFAHDFTGRMAGQQVHRNVYTGALALAVDSGRAGAVFDVEQFAFVHVTLRGQDGQVLDIGMALTVLFHHAHVYVVFFAVFGVLAGFVAAHRDVVVRGDRLERHAVVGEGLAVRDKADFGLTRFVARLEVHDAVDFILDAVHHELRGLDDGVRVQAVHFEHHVAGGVVVHFGCRCGLDGNVGVRDVGEVGTQGVDNLVGTAGTSFPVLQKLHAHRGLVHRGKAVRTAHVHAVVHNLGHALDAAFDDSRNAVGRLDVGTHGHFELDADHALVLLRHDFHGQEVLREESDEHDRADKCCNLENHARNGKAERERLEVNETHSVQDGREYSENLFADRTVPFDDVPVLVLLHALEQVGRHERGKREGHEERHERGEHHGKAEGAEEDTGDGLHEGDRHEHAHVGERRCHDGHHDFGGSLEGCILRVEPEFQLFVDVFKHHDGVRNEQAHR